MKLVIALSVGLFVCQAYALPLPGVTGLKPPSGLTNELYYETNVDSDSSDYNFNGIAKLSNCSGALFHFEGQSLDQKALVLTNGHCVQLMDPNEVMVQQSAYRSFRIFNRNNKFASKSFRAERLLYGTMKNTDLAVYRLGVSYRDLAETHEIDSLLMSDMLGEINEDIAVVSGYFKSISACQLEAFVPELRESRWTFRDSLRYSPECEVIHGTSGSPVVALDGGHIVGVNNTVYEGGEACTINNPCEVNPDGSVTTLEDRGYGQQTFQLYSCLTSDFQIDLSLPGCELPKPVAKGPGIQNLFQIAYW